MISIPQVDLAFKTECAKDWISPWNNSACGHKLWQELFSIWLSDLESELPHKLQAKSYTLGLRLINDRQIKILNKTWRGINNSTDVLSFPTQEDPYILNLINDKDTPIELGDIIISVETADKQAIDFGHSLVEELHWLVSHGLLHLLGWNHPDEISLNTMLKRQERLLLKSADQRTKT